MIFIIPGGEPYLCYAILRISKLALLNSKKRAKSHKKWLQCYRFGTSDTEGRDERYCSSISIESTLTKAHSSRQTVNSSEDATPFIVS